MRATVERVYMTATPKVSREVQRAELHRTIWKMANDLRGSIDGWDFKQYVLGFLFYRFISENIVHHLEANEGEDFEYANLSDEEVLDMGGLDDQTIEEKGFFILPSQLFVNTVANARTNENLNTELNEIFKAIEGSSVGRDSEDDFKGLFSDIDTNASKLGDSVASKNRLLVKIMEAIASLNFGKFSDNSIDAFGDAYEYLMTMYASAAGKSGGEFFTPQEVSELLAKISIDGRTEINKVYDPTCGSGSLLLKFEGLLGKNKVRDGFYGQEINLTTYNLCRINMFLHDINYSKINIAYGNTLTDPKHLNDQPFQAIVANPPYSIKWDGSDDPTLITDERFSPAGVLAPKSKADLAFIMHVIHHLADDGVAAIVEFPGVLYRMGAEQKIRKYLIEENLIDAIIQLPEELFYGTSISTCILVLRKNKQNTDVLMVDASQEFTRRGKSNVIDALHQDKIVKSLAERKDIEYFAKLVTQKQIADNEYILTVGNFVAKEDLTEVIDIEELNARIEGIVANQQVLRTRVAEAIVGIEATLAQRREVQALREAAELEASGYIGIVEAAL